MQLMLYVRAILFYLGYAFFTVFFSLSGALLFFLPISIRGRYLILWNQCVLIWLRLCCNIRVKIIGDIPSGSFVAACKHQSQWETFFLQHHLWPVHIVLKKELLNIPFFGWALRMVEPIAIDRTQVKSALVSIQVKGSYFLERNRRVLIFPEGTRVKPGNKNRYARSAADLAVRSQRPILPIAHNAAYCWPPGQLIKYPGTITISFGEPIQAEQKTSRELMLCVEQWIEAECENIGTYAHV